MTIKKLRAAIYTRKSTEYGLEQDFNSLAAQREAAEAYITSQKSQGWILVNDNYDDGGISGGTMERPALQKLLEDIKRGQVHIIVVYKVDRLTRSLTDFSRIIELLDEADASFVSVTQQFNTTDSMGRLTLNVLLSFAQFEREVTSERIRDKILASKQKGMWMGGTVPLGYDNADKKLVVNTNEAKIVRLIFNTYLTSSGIKETCQKINDIGHRTKSRNGGRGEGGKFWVGHVNYILKNRLYVGEIAHKGKHYPGNHEAIIDRTIWDKVQTKIEASKANIKNGTHFVNPSLLCGLLKTDAGEPLIPTHTKKGATRYRYYITKSEQPSHKAVRYPAKEIETAVIQALKNSMSELFECQFESSEMISRIEADNPVEVRAALLEIVDGISISKDQSEITLSSDFDNHDQKTISAEIEIKECSRGRKSIIPSGEQVIQEPDQKLIKLIAKAHLYAKELQSGKYLTMGELADKFGINKSDLGRQLRLAYLAPDLTKMIIEGRHPSSINTTIFRRLRYLPIDWNEQTDVMLLP